MLNLIEKYVSENELLPFAYFVLRQKVFSFGVNEHKN